MVCLSACTPSQGLCAKERLIAVVADHDGEWSTGFVNLDCDEGVDPGILNSA
jgi:hypothetical protein